MNLRKYITLTRAGMMESLHFRTSAFVTILGNIIYLVIIYYLWKAIYASTGTSIVNGMTFEDTMIYLVLATALFYFMEMYLVWNMGRDIQSGSIVLKLIRPMSFKKYMFFSCSGSFVMSFFMTFLPTALIVYFITNGAIYLGSNLVFFLISVILGLLINFYVDFFVGTICLYTESIWGINIMKEVVVLLLSGASIPLAFFPESLKNVVMVLPFQAIYNTPLNILIRHNLNNFDRITMLGIQLFWVIILSIITSLFWKRSVRQITVNGG
jgi:ABC-2 type transport system permease protein